MHAKLAKFLTLHSRKLRLAEWEDGLLTTFGIKCAARNKGDAVFLVPEGMMSDAVEGARQCGLQEMTVFQHTYASESLPGARRFIIGSSQQKGCDGEKVTYMNRLVLVPMELTGLTIHILFPRPVNRYGPIVTVSAVPFASACKALLRLISASSTNTVGVAVFGSQLRNLLVKHTYRNEWKNAWLPNKPLEPDQQVLRDQALERLRRWRFTVREAWMERVIRTIMVDRRLIIANFPRT